MALLRPNKFFFIFTLLSGTLLSVSSSSWFMSWLGLELNLLSFIPLIFSEKNSYSSESALKYFLIQAMGSAVILVGATALMLTKEVQSQKVIVSALLLKMGAGPVHFWLPTIMQGLSWGSCMLLMTAQKIAPMGMLLYSDSMVSHNLLMGASILSGILGGIGGLNQVLIRKLLAYSSISHMGWLLAAICYDSLEWGFYFTLYSFTVISMVFVLNSTQVYHSFQITNLVCGPVDMVGVFLALFSMGGLPPLLGFLAKIIVIGQLTFQECIIWVFILTMSSLITLYFYTRLFLTTLTLKGPKLNSSSLKFNIVVGLFTLFTWVMIITPFFFH